MRRVSPVMAEAGPLRIELMRGLSLEIGVGGGALGEAGVPVGLGTIGFATAHSASRFLRLAAYLVMVLRRITLMDRL
jgi:hypothetical protein